MRIWIFDSITGELIPTAETDKGQNAPESPCEPGKYLEIKYSTTTRAPEGTSRCSAASRIPRKHLLAGYSCLIALVRRPPEVSSWKNRIAQQLACSWLCIK